jgi:hypothetical protein
MKTLLTLCLLMLAPFLSPAWAGDSTAPSSARVVAGKVLEVQEVESYTYLRLKTKDGETWAAVSKTPIKLGAEVMIENVTLMNNFESKSLKKTFPSIVFGTLGGAGKDVAKASLAATPMTDTSPIKVPKASGANARTVAEVMRTAAKLKDQPVRVRGKVVKYNTGIMGKNWIHLRDGTGAAADNTHDVLVTTTAQAKLGDVVTVTGVVRTDKDFGSGYTYKVLIEEATLQP